MATTVRITETYDLKTTVNKLGLIGIHTPTTALLNRMYPGLIKNHKFVRFLKCDVTGACASVLPADPLQVGVESGDVAPEDMFNPILYKAVTNESFDTISARITNQTNLGSLGSVNRGEMLSTSSAVAFNSYYTFLADNKSFRKVMPQAGFRIRGLVPICHTLISTYGNVSPIGNKTVWTPDPSDPGQGVVEGYVPDLSTTPSMDASLNKKTTDNHDAVVFRGKSVRMPKIPLHYGNETATAMSSTMQIPNTFVLAMIIPPARLHEFYYRMRVTWTVRFENVVSTVPYANVTQLTATTPYTYYSDYSYESSKSDLENKENMVDADAVTINKIMES